MRRSGLALLPSAEPARVRVIPEEDVTRCRAEYDGPVLRGLTEYVRARLTERGELIPLGFSWAFVITIDVSLACIAVVATLQRPVETEDVSMAIVRSLRR